MAAFGRPVFENRYMLKTLIFLIAVIAPFQSGMAKSGGTDGGGGSVIQCQLKPEVILTTDENGKAVLGLAYDEKAAQAVMLTHDRKYQLTDLWEAEHGYGPFENHRLNKMMFDDVTPVDEQLNLALGRLKAVNPKFSQAVKGYLKLVKANILPIPQDSYVMLPQDTDIRYMKKGCTLEGFGYYSDRQNNLVIDPAIREKISKIDEAAFFMHEAIYKLLRDQKKETDSWRTRRIVGFLFSEEPYTWKDLWQK